VRGDRSGESAGPWHPGRWGIATRLLGLLLVPLLGLGAFASAITRSRLDAAGQAADIERTVGRTNQLVAAQAALFAERGPTESVALVRQRGSGAATKAANHDLVRALAARRAGTDAAVAALGPGAPISRDELEVLRTDLDSGAPGLTVTLFRPLEERLDAAMVAMVAANRTHNNLIAGGSDTAQVLEATRTTIEAVDSSLNQLAAIESLFSGLGDEAVLTHDLVAANAREDTELARLDDAFVPPVTDAWRQVRNDPTTLSYFGAVDRMAGGDTARRSQGTAASERLDQFARDAVTHQDNLLRLIPVFTTAARDIAASQRASADEDVRLSILLPVLLAAATAAVSLWFVRSISRPYRRLGAHAAAIGSGDLTVEPLRGGGPREITVAFEAFNDLVANLRLIEAKGQALADLDFDAPVLAEALPGRLGASLQRSAGALSGSIGERDDLRRRLLRQATHDELTGLHNRAAASDELDQALARARRADGGVAVVQLDLDDFKRTNDTHGNTVGDQVLGEIAARLQAVAGDGTFVARLAGDEFVVLAEDVRDPGAVDQMARRLRAAAARPIVVGDLRITTGACVGIAFSWDGADEADQLLAHADLAVARAKQRAPGSIEIYDQSLQQQLRETAEIEDALTAAIPGDELFLQCQPVIDLATGRMSSVEALVRWRRPEGIQPPDSFIPVAERSDLIVTLDRWVMARAVRQMQEWDDHPDLADVRVAVNVSGRHLLNQTLHRHVVDLLDSTGLDPHRLIVEITETVLVDDLIVAAAQLEAVRGLGVRIALDDFGTGYSSITHLRQLPIDIIKIDRSFVERLGNEKDRTLLAMISDLGHHLGLTITAEGVETAEQYDLLRELGCDRAQGFLMSRPLLPDALESWVQDHQSPASARVSETIAVSGATRR
jgi:diguanylate cyclase (GGDEF)-like protein